MSHRPISDFLLKLRSFNPDDVAVMFALLGYQEVAMTSDTDGLISATIEDWLIYLDIPPDRIRQSLERLVACGELQREEGGYWVTRYQELVGTLAAFGVREYNRRKAKERRDRILAQETASQEAV